MKPIFLLTKILLTGGIILGLELAAARVMMPFFGASLYVWSAVLAVTLTALALGYKAGGMLSRRLGHEHAILLFASSGALAGLWVNLAAWTYPFLFWPLANFDLVLGSIVACLYLLFVPLVILSALNPLLVALLPRDGKGDHGAGNVFFISTVGSVLGVFVVAYGLLPYITNYITIIIMALAMSMLSLAALLLIHGTAGRLYRCAVTMALASCLIAGGTLATGGLERLAREFTHNGKTFKITHASPSYYGHIQVLDIFHATGAHASRSLLVDGMTQNQFYQSGTSATLFTYALERIALAAANHPEKALVLGVAAGVVPMNFARRGMAVQAIDINPAIIEVAENYLGLQRNIMDLRTEDARMAARACDNDRDIIIIDLFRDDGIPEHLVTREFFSDLHGCLRDNGVIVMNSFMMMQDMRSQYALLKTIADVFGQVTFYQRPPATGTDFTSGFIVARKGGPVGTLAVSYSDMPDDLAVKLRETMDSSLVLHPGDPLFSSVPILTDIGNRWKNLILPVEISFRERAVTHMPWQIFLN